MNFSSFPLFTQDGDWGSILEMAKVAYQVEIRFDIQKEDISSPYSKSLSSNAKLCLIIESGMKMFDQ